jgi:protein tyrosine phosphatase
MGPVEEFELHNRQNSWQAFFDELHNLSFAKQELSSKDARRPKFRNRNRYADVSPYDHSRVRLLRNNIDYINASLVAVPEADRSYILTQGPLIETAGHFWLMVWEQDSRAVIMLNRIIEKEQVKCYQYYPAGSENEGGNEMVFNDVGLKVTFITESRSNYHFTKRVLQLQDLQSEEVRQILHFHYTAWPDFRVPSSSTAFLDFLFAIRNEKVLDYADRPPVIHCSAGIGRSGTICLIDTCLVLAAKNGGDLGSVSVANILMQMRQCRMGLIQTADQLRFSYLAIIDGAGRLFSGTDNADIPLDNKTLNANSSELCKSVTEAVSVDAESKEIDDTLDEFSQMLSDYGSSADVGTAMESLNTENTPSAAQIKLESLFLPPTGNINQHIQTQADGVLQSEHGNPSNRIVVADNSATRNKEAEVAAAAAHVEEERVRRQEERETRRKRMEQKIADIKQRQRESETRQNFGSTYVIAAVSLAVAVVGYLVYHYIT